MKKVKWFLWAVGVVAFLSSLGVFGRDPLTFEERVKAQEAIERVYYSHRIWPKENPGPKPPFEQMVTKEQIEAKVTDYLKKSAALDQFWQRPIEGKQLQAEMGRMAKGTKDPQTLNELFKALNDDPYLIAECLARPVLADRLVRNWYSNDERFHKEAREKAEETLRTISPNSFCTLSNSQYSKVTYVLDMKKESFKEMPNLEGKEIILSPEEFAVIYDEAPEEGMITGVEQTTDCYLIKHTLIKNNGRLQIESIIFPKKCLAEWIGESGVQAILPDDVVTIEDTAIPPLPENGCVEEWTPIAGNVPTGRINFTSVWTGSEMIVWGGNNTFELASGAVYNLATDTWRPTSQGTNCPSKRNFHSAVWTGSRMIIWGGISGSPFNDGGIYDPLGDSWSLISSISAPSLRYKHTAIWTGTEMVVWGGYNGTSYLNNGGRYKLLDNTWTALSEVDAPAPRWEHTAVWATSEMIVWGGNAIGHLNTGGRYNPVTNTWTSTSMTNAPSVRSQHTAVWTGTEMIIWGGLNTQPLNTGGRYNPSTNSWNSTSVGTSCPSARDNHSAVWTDTHMIIWGGGAARLNSGGIYNPINDTWSSTSTENSIPAGRNSHKAIWTGSEMVIWGGWGGTYFNSGGRYNPSTNNWIPTSTETNTPSARMVPVFCWTGSEMIVWAGYDGNTADYLNSGGKYNPSTDSWTPTSMLAYVPEKRITISAIWTGNEMIVWGGFNGGFLNSGGRYNPASDSWIPTSTGTNVPEGREYYVEVWTGTEMIVWGGEGGIPPNYYFLNTGGRYNPSSDSWIATSTGINVPSSRYFASAVWTGTDMIVWGGGDPQTNTGAIYNPPNNNWTPTSVGVNVPSSRRFHSAVWDGNKMIVWGGLSGASPTNSGGKYSPSEDSWTPTSFGTSCPEARSGNSIIWTENEMIIWGGVNGANYYNSGGRYTPSTDTWVPTFTGTNVPVGRHGLAAVWTGDQMIIWAGVNASQYFSNGCSYAPGYPPLPVVTGESSGCGSVILSVQPYDGYQWNMNGSPIAGAIHPTFEATQSGNYTVTTTTLTGCAGTRTSNVFSLVISGCLTLNAEPAFTPGLSNNISWNVTNKAIAYEAQSSTDNFNSIFASSGQITETNFTFIGLSEGLEYQYRVRAVYSWGVSEWSNVARSIQDAGAPSSIIVNPTSGGLLFDHVYVLSGTSFDQISGVAFVELSWDNGVSWHNVSGTTYWTYSWTLPADGTYTLWIRAADIVGNVEAAHSIPVIVQYRPLPPTNVRVTDVPYDGGGVLDITWTLSGDDGTGLNYISGYSIYRAESLTGFYKKITWVPAGKTYVQDPEAGTGVNHYYKVRAETDWDVNPNYTDSDIFGPIAATDDAPLPVNNLLADLTYACNVRLVWIESPSPDILLYNIYYDNGTGTVNYSTPLASVNAPAVTWVSSGLALNTRYIFAVRAKDYSGKEDGLTTNQVSISTECSSGFPRAEIKQPQAGRKINGQKVTVIADLIQGTTSQIQNIRFQYRTSGGGGWVDLLPNSNNDQNPDTSFPYLIHWDVTTISNGDYDLRAVASNLSGQPDPEPPFVTITIDNDHPNLQENMAGGNHQAYFEAYRGSGNSNITGMERDNTQVRLTIPKGGMPVTLGNTGIREEDPSVYSLKPAKGIVNTGKGFFVLTEALNVVGVYRTITLPGNQAAFSTYADLVIFYRDDNNDGIVDGTTVPALQLDVFRQEATDDWSLQNSNRSVDTTNKFIRVTITQAGTFGLFSYPKPATVNDLKMEPSGNDARVYWPAVTKDDKNNSIVVDHYNIYVGSAPDFYPDLINHTNLLPGGAGQVTGLQTYDAGTMTGTESKFYLVTAVDGTGKESYPR